jgi:hypothetical protein
MALPRESALVAAAQIVKEVGLAEDTEEYVHDRAVHDTAMAAGDAAQERTEGLSSPAADLFEWAVAHAASLAAIIRKSLQEPPLTEEEIRRITDFYEFIFNDLFHR